MSELQARQAEHLLRFLDEQGISQKKLAESLGVSAQSVNRWVNGKVRMRDDSAAILHEIWPEHPASWYQGVPTREEIKEQAIEIMARSLERKSAELKTVMNTFQAFVLVCGYDVNKVPNGNDIAQILPDGSKKTISKGYDVKLLTDDGKECVLTGKQWDYLRNEVISYTKMRVNAIIERGTW